MNDHVAGEARSTRSMSTAELLREQSECVKQLLAENSTLCQQLAAANARLAAAEILIGKRYPFQWHFMQETGSSRQLWIYKDEDGSWYVETWACDSMGTRTTSSEFSRGHDTPTDAVLAAVAANWLPAELQQQGGG